LIKLANTFLPGYKCFKGMIIANGCNVWNVIVCLTMQRSGY